LGQRKEVILAPLFIVSMSPPSYPSAWLRPRSAASVSPGKNIVAPPRLARPTSGCPVVQDWSAGASFSQPVMEEQRRASWRCSDTPDQTWRTSNRRPIC